MRVYRYVGFDPDSNRERWRRVHWLRLRLEWLCDLLAGDRCAKAGYRAWLYCNVTEGDMCTYDMLDWNQEVVR